MPAAKATYDLILLLDLAASDEDRAKIVADTRAMILAGGEVVTDQKWGTRPLAFQIGHREQAEYHLLQFQGPPELISTLDHTLRIADGVVRHRIIKVAPGTPAPPEQSAPRTAVAAAATPASEPLADDALAPA
ncbi:MAG: 30S ribosomal protein S6 [Solirubrobacteraceae bacterium]